MTQVANPAAWLAGYIPDLPTPFDESDGIDLTAFAKLCERQIEAGVSAIVQPGGSVRDEEVIQAADEFDIAMVFTGKRQFRH